MGGGVFEQLYLIKCACNNSAVADDDGTNWNLLGFESSRSLTQGFTHEIVIALEIYDWFRAGLIHCFFLQSRSLDARLSSSVHSFLPSAPQRQCAAKKPLRCCQNHGQICSRSVCGTFMQGNFSRAKNSNRPSRCCGGSV